MSIQIADFATEITSNLFDGTAGLNSTNAPLFEMVNTGTDTPQILEIAIETHIPVTSQTPISILLGRTTSLGVITTGLHKKIPFLSIDFSQVAGCYITTTWQTAPGIPTKFLRRGIIQPATSGSGQGELVWRFPRGLKFLPSTSMGLWFTSTSNQNPSTVPIYHITIMVDS